MARDPQTITIRQQSILWVAGMGVGLLTFAYVLGVQVGKQSVALRRPPAKGLEEELKELPEPLVDQLKLFEGNDPQAGVQAGEAKLVPAQKTEGEAKAEAPEKEKPAPKEEAKAKEDPKSERWTLQLLAASNAPEAKAMVDKLKAAGFKATVVKDKGAFKVRLSEASPRADVDAQAAKLKKRGFKPFAVKAE